MFFRLSSFELGLLIFAIVLGGTFLGIVLGRRLRPHARTLSEPFGVIQGALLGLVGLILAFGLTMAVGRYDNRRQAVVDESNATHLIVRLVNQACTKLGLNLYRQDNLVLAASAEAAALGIKDVLIAELEIMLEDCAIGLAA